MYIWKTGINFSGQTCPVRNDSNEENLAGTENSTSQKPRGIPGSVIAGVMPRQKAVTFGRLNFRSLVGQKSVHNVPHSWER